MNQLKINWINCLSFSRMRGKMRFWSKTKHGEKKLPRENQSSRSEAGKTQGISAEQTRKHVHWDPSQTVVIPLLSIFVSQKACLPLTVRTWRRLLLGGSGTARRTRSRLLRWGGGAVWRSAALPWNLPSGRTMLFTSSRRPTTTAAWMTSSWRRCVAIRVNTWKVPLFVASKSFFSGLDSPQLF